MTVDQLLRLAVQIGAKPHSDPERWGHLTISHEDVERFAALVAAHEREECRLIVLDNSDAEGICCTDDVLEALRQRGEQ